jgi:hypothetical protein
MEEKKEVYQENYCTQLIKHPKEGLAYLPESWKNFYFCRVSRRPCVAREKEDNSHKPIINKKLLKLCPISNIPDEVVNDLFKSIANYKILEKFGKPFDSERELPER